MSMQEQLRAKFLEQFMETGLKRLADSQQAVSEDNAERAASELHSLAGECSILGFEELGELARKAEAQAKSWLAGTSSSRVQCGRSLRLISRGLAAIADAPRAAGPSKKTVLIIDDSEIVAAHMQESLEEAGFAVHWAEELNGAAAYAQETKPALIMVDANIPGVSTSEVVEKLRAASKDSKLLLVSGLDDDELSALVQELSLDGFISKQKGVDAVVNAAQECLPGAKG